MQNRIKILAVDDEAFNLDILTEYLEDEGYEVIPAEDGVIALEQLEKHPDIDVIVLDRMMPRLNGLEVMEKIKAHPEWRDIPVIMQTAAASSGQVLQGIQAGVFYYLTKPYEENLLLSIVRSALGDINNKRKMRDEMRKQKRVLGLMEEASFRFRTLEEAKNLAYLVANSFPDPEMAVYGLSELMINAVEHGNLGISYQEKTKLVLEGTWENEIIRRLALPENEKRFASLHFVVTENKVSVHIKDQGAGFDWHNYLEISPQRATDPNGRGIATSRMLSFGEVEYLGTGNEVICRATFTTEN